MKKRLKKIVSTIKKVGTLNLVLMFVGAFFYMVQLADDLAVQTVRQYAGNICMCSCGSNDWRVWHMRLDPDKQRQAAGSEMGKRGQEEARTRRRQYGRK